MTSDDWKWLVLIFLTCVLGTVIGLFIAKPAQSMCWVGACPTPGPPPPPAIGCREMVPVCICDAQNCCSISWVCVP